jgi:glycosyltransferase involved in cell wall biosynthesis
VTYELVFVNDGSTDRSAEILHDLAARDAAIRILTLSRNFGKEVATTAGIHAAHGQAILTIDADGQFPVERIPAFVEKWQAGARVVIGRRQGRVSGFGKRVGTKLFYYIFQRLMGVRIDPSTSDFRLIDQEVQAQFNRLTERHRMTKALIDWLGYEREYVPYTENPRLHGDATYSYRKLFKLAIDSAISLSISPLYITAYIGAVVLPLATLLGLGMIANWLLGDPLGLHATGGAYLIVLILFLIGVLLVSQGIIGLYLSHIHTETQNRPLYVIDEAHSRGLS